MSDILPSDDYDVDDDDDNDDDIDDDDDDDDDDDLLFPHTYLCMLIFHC